MMEGKTFQKLEGMQRAAKETDSVSNETKAGRFAAVILAAGRGSRMKSKVQKQYMLLDGKPLIYYSLKTFEDGPVNDIVLVAGENEIEYCRNEIIEKYGFSKILAVVPGGTERYHSVYEGLKCLERQGGYGQGDYVLVHDGARPFADAGVIARVMEDSTRYGACVAGMLSKDTVKLSDEDGFAKVTPDRSLVWTIQTPQGFSYSLLRSAYDKMMSRGEYQAGVTDDAMAVELMTRRKVKLTEGSYRNIKVTTPEDMLVAEAFLHDTGGI